MLPPEESQGVMMEERVKKEICRVTAEVEALTGLRSRWNGGVTIW